jgi:cytochrome P450
MRQPADRPVRFSVKQLRADLLGTQKLLVREHDGFARYRVLHRVFTLLADAEASRRLLVSEPGICRRGRPHDNLALAIGRGLICSEGAVWQRQLAQPVFGKALLARVVEITAGLATETVDGWERARRRGEPVEVFDDMQTLALRVIGLALFSHDLKTAPIDFAETVRTGLEVVIRRNLSPVTLPLWVPTRLHRRFNRRFSAIDRFLAERIEERLADRDGYRDILADLIRGYGERAPEFRRELRDQVITLFFAGFETTAAALAWTWLLLSQHPEAEREFHRELADVLGGRVPTQPDLSSLTYTHQIIQESMRMYPPVYSLPRAVAADDQAGDHRIRRGENLVIPIHALHRMGDYWDRPDTFCPERFAPGILTKTQRHAYLPFSAGPRRCLGASFATAEMLTVLAVAGQRVRLRLADGHPVSVAVAVTQRPAHGLPMRIEPGDGA